MANAKQGPTSAASGRISGKDDDPADTADFQGGEVVGALSDTESDVNKSTATLDKEARMRAELAEQKPEGPRATVWGNVDGDGNVLSPYAVEGNNTSAYVGVNPEYATYANETDRPYRAEEGTAERYFEDQITAPKKFAVAAPFGSNQTEGGGSSVPLLYPDVSGEAYVNEPVKVTEAPEGNDAAEDSAPTQTKDGATPSEKAAPSEF